MVEVFDRDALFKGNIPSYDMIVVGEADSGPMLTLYGSAALRLKGLMAMKPADSYYDLATFVRPGVIRVMRRFDVWPPTTCTRIAVVALHGMSDLIRKSAGGQDLVVHNFHRLELSC